MSNLRKLAGGALIVMFCSGTAIAERLIGDGDEWRYYKGFSTPPAQNGLNWTQAAFNDTGWGPASPSGFGYGDGDDSTTFGDMQQTSGQSGYASLFVRRSFSVANPAAITLLTLAIDYDDGFVAYVNGVEVARRNMPAGSVAHNTLASTAHEASRGGGAENPQEKEFIAVNPALLTAGTNVLAISGHNSSLGSTDFTLRPELYANVTLLRGPFLQMPAAGQMSVVWRTDALTDSAVDYGADANYSGGTVSDATLTRQHIVTLPPLASGTTMYYRVRSGGVTLAQSSFKTPPDATQPFRFVVYGDFGWGNSATGVPDGNVTAVANRVSAMNPDLTLTVGDNIYDNGQPGHYDPFWFAPYDTINRRAPLFPALGNHDVDNSMNGQPFIDNFHLPQNGPSSYRERSYSFDYGNAHFAVVDVNPFVFKIDTNAQAAIKSWLAADLASSAQRWKIVLFHQPAYTSTGAGVHNPETILQNELQPLFVRHGVNVVFQGHNHFYERINPINGVHYITSGGGGRSLHNPTNIAEYSAARSNSVFSATQVDIAGGLLTLRQIDAAGNQIDSMEINLDHVFKVDGLLDSTQWLRAGVSGTLRIHAAIRGYHLYLATQDAGEASDHFIYLADQLGPMQAANWSKTGQVMRWSAFLADENDNGFKGWFNGAGQPIAPNGDYTATTSGLNNNGSAGNGVLEGTVNLEALFGAWPQQIYVAAAPFGTGGGGTLVSSAQAPAGNGDGNIGPEEFRLLNLREIALDLPASSAGADASVEAGMPVLLSGTANVPSGLPLSVAWSQLSGPPGTINDVNTLAASFTATANVSQASSVVLQLRVNDTRFDTDDIMTIELFPMVDLDSDGLSDQEEITGQNNTLTAAAPAGRKTEPNRSDTDGDGANDGDEALAGTDSNSAADSFRILSLQRTDGQTTLTWSSVAGRQYRVQMREHISDGWSDVGEDITAAGSTLTATVTAAAGAVFYRVRIAP